LFGGKIVESRTPPHLSAASAAGLGRLPSTEAMRASLVGDGFSLRPDALCIPRLLADLLGVHDLETRAAA
ncbi:MAG TPA: hypothetical protein VH682_13300, partial [Gemmataceae bacterium]